MTNLTRSAVNVFAVLEDFREGSSDVLDGLVPFFEPILCAHNGERFDPKEFSKEVCDTYKWNFLPDIAEEFVPRFVARGWLQSSDKIRPSGPYTIRMDERQPTAAETRIASALFEIAKKLKQFSESLSPITTLAKDVDRYQDMLVEWLLYIDAYSDSNTQVNVRAVKDESGKIIQRVAVPNTTSLSDDEIYLCARFVEHSIREDEKVAKTLYNIASIGLLTEVVQDFFRPTSSVNKSNLVVYLDTPLAMELIGVSGKAAQNNVLPIIEGLKAIGVSFRIFSTSIEEIMRNLEAVLSSPNRTGPTARALGQGSVLEAYVREVARNPEIALKQFGVRVVHRTLDQFPNQIVYFDDGQYSDLCNGLTFHQENPIAREHDATIATHILRMRKDYSTSDIFHSKYLVVTGNGIFARQSRRVCIRLDAIRSNAIPPVVHRRVLATAAWLRTGLSSNYEEVPRHHIMASCERVLSLKPSVVRAVKRFSENLSEEKAKQLDLLLARDRSSQMLMDKTLGVSAVVSADNIDDLFEEMLSPYLAEKEQEFGEKLQTVRDEEREKAVAQFVKIEEAQSEAKQYQGELSDREREDLVVIKSLGHEVELRLRKKILNGKIASIAIALLLTLGSFGVLGTSSIVTWFVAIFSALLAYLGITGSVLLQTKISPETCIAELTQMAENRSLATKLKRFEISWDKSSFIIRPKEADTDQLDM